MATKATPTTPDTDTTPDAPVEAVVDAPVQDHDRAVTNVGSGRITFKGHNAKAGYPYRIYEGQVEALVDGEWVTAEDSQPV